MNEQEKEEMLKDRKELAKKKGVSYLEVYCGNCEHGKGLYGGWLCCEFLFNHSVEEYSYCEEWTKRKDMVEVVRCKDCKRYTPFRNIIGGEMDEGECEGYDPCVPANHFCSRGERREE